MEILKNIQTFEFRETNITNINNNNKNIYVFIKYKKKKQKTNIKLYNKGLTTACKQVGISPYPITNLQKLTPQPKKKHPLPYCSLATFLSNFFDITQKINNK